jgi:Domain of unknown function (DUF4115)
VKLGVAAIMVCGVTLALSVVLSRGGSGPAAGKRRPPPSALVIQVTGAQCLVFVRRPGGEVLINQTLTNGQSVHFDVPPFDVVVGDVDAVKVYVHGRPWPVRQTAFTVS